MNIVVADEYSQLWKRANQLEYNRWQLRTEKRINNERLYGLQR